MYPYIYNKKNIIHWKCFECHQNDRNLNFSSSFLVTLKCFFINVFPASMLDLWLIHKPLANAHGSDTRQDNKSEPRVNESEPRALASGLWISHKSISQARLPKGHFHSDRSTSVYIFFLSPERAATYQPRATPWVNI